MPSTFCTTQLPRFTGLVRSPGEFWVMKTAMGSRPPRPYWSASSTRTQWFDVALDSRYAVVLGQHWIHKGVVAIDQVEHGAVVLNGVFDVADRFLKHGFAQIVVELGKALAIDGVVGFEETEVEPVAGELGGQAAHAGILHHAAGLRQQNCRFLQVVRGRVPQQLLVGHAGPQEVAQAARQGVAG